MLYCKSRDLLKLMHRFHDNIHLPWSLLVSVASFRNWTINFKLPGSKIPKQDINLIKSFLCFVALATTTTPKLLKTAVLYRRCLVRSPNLFMQYLGDLPSLALKASRYGLCVSFGASVCHRPFQISSWAPSLNWAAVDRSNQRDGDWSVEITGPLAISSVHRY